MSIINNNYSGIIINFVLLIILIDQISSTIDESKVIVEQFLNAEVDKQPQKNNQYWAETILAQLSALYPWYRFLVIANSQVDGDVLWHKDYGYYVEHKGKRNLVVYVYMSFATDIYEGNTDCYGNITDMFQSCTPATDGIVRFIGDECGQPRYNSESVGIRAIIRDENNVLGLVWTLPDRAVKHEVVRCRGPRAGNKRWHIIIALFQRMQDVAVKFVETLEKEHPQNFTQFPLLDTEYDLEGQNSTLWPILFAALALNLLFLSIILLTIFLLYKLRKNIRKRGTFGIYLKAAWFFVPNGAEKELDNTLVDIEHLIYTGPNSRVYFARYRFSEADYRNVVVKVPSRDAFHLGNIEAEMHINAQLRHPRVVEYIGFYRDAFGDVRIVSEFMAGGDLHTFLSSKKNTITVGHVFNFLAQVAEGMEYLISKRLIHRDLATRNCMLNQGCGAIKIADFGLSRQFNADANYASSSPVKLPLRWMPLECFDGSGEILRNCKFNEKTDVWAFGVVVWECFTRGAQPYGSEDFKEVIVRLKEHGERCAEVADGGGMVIRLAKPECCPRIVYEQLMLRCWEDKQLQRPTFSAIRAKLDEIFETMLGIYPDAFIQNIPL